MKKITILLFMMLLAFSWQSSAQSTINITTSGGAYPGEKWVSITTEADGGGTLVWGQGATQCEDAGLINVDIDLAPGTYYVNCYDQYDDSWDGTLISVTAYGAIIGNNGGVTPDDGEDTDAGFACEGTPEELEASFEIIVPLAPSCIAPSLLGSTPMTSTTAELSWTASLTETSWNIEVVDLTAGETVTGMATATGVTTNPYALSGLTEGNNYEFYIQSDCAANGTSVWNGPFAWSQNVRPVNDIPAGAIPITPSAEGTGCTADTFSLTFSTDFTSDSGVQGGCSTSGLDQFFTWTATTEGLTFSSGTGGPGIVVWDATTLTEVSCLATFATDALLSGWLIGQDLIIQIYDFEGSISDVTFCLEEYAFPTAPDCPTNPTPIDGATDVTGGDLTLTWDAPVSGPTPTSYDLYSGAMSDGSDFTLVGNFTTNSADVTLDYDATVYYEVRSKNGASESAMCSIWSFTTGSAPLPPVNDDIANATTISIGEMICDGNINNGTNISATDSGEGAGTCFFGGAGSDVWYTFTLPSDDIVTVSTDYTGGTLTDTQIAIFSGTSGALVQEGCDQDSGSTTLSNGSDYNSIIEDLDLTAGTYYVQVSGYNGQVGTFCLSLDAQSLNVETVQNEAAFTYFPNPVKNTLTLNAQKTIEQVAMYNMLGQEVLRATPNALASDLDMSNLQTGTYFVKVTIANVTETIRVIKQ